MNARPIVEYQEKRTCHLVYFDVPSDYTIEIKEREKINKIESCQREEKSVVHKGDSDTNKIWNTKNST